MKKQQSINIQLIKLEPFNFYDPRAEFIKILKQKKMLKKPYLGYPCDFHYSELGANLLANYTFKIFEEFLKR